MTVTVSTAPWAKGDELAGVPSRLFIELTDVRVLKSVLRSRSSRS